MSTYDTTGASDVRLADGPGVGTALLVSDSAAETSLATIAGTVASGKVAVTDAAAETALTALAALITASKLAVTDAAAESALTTLAGTVSAGKVQVSTAAAGASLTISITAAEAAFTIKNGVGTLYAIVVTTPGTAPLQIRDGASGNVLAIVPANQPVGDLPMYGGGRPYATSLYCASGANTPAVTVIYS